MKNIFKIQIDASQLKGAISSVTSLQEKTKDLKSELGSITDDLIKNIPAGIGALGKLRGGVEELKGSVGQLKNKFSDFGMSVRGLVTNVFSKFTSVLKTSMMGIGAIIGAVTGLFNMANGTNRTMTSAAMAGLSYAEQKALDDANEETGFNADFATNRAGFHQGADTMAAKALLEGGLLSAGEFDALKNDSQSYYKLNDKLYDEYKRIRSMSADENTTDETFKQMYGNVLQQFGYGDFANFKLANEKGVIARHKQTFDDTHKAYSGVDADALLKGERALNQFSETMKAFALGVAAKFLPGLTKGLKSLTGLFQKLSDYATESGLLKEIADAIGSLVDLIVTAGETVMGLISKLMGGSVTEYVKDAFGAASSTFKGVTAWIKGDKEGREKHFADAKEKRDRIHEKNNNVLGNTVGAVTSLVTNDQDTIDKAKNIAKGFGETLYGINNAIGGAGLDTAKGITDNDGTPVERLVKSQEQIQQNNIKRLNDMNEKINEHLAKAGITNNSTLNFTIQNPDGSQSPLRPVTLEQQMDMNGRIMQQRIRQ